MHLGKSTGSEGQQILVNLLTDVFTSPLSSTAAKQYFESTKK